MLPKFLVGSYKRYRSDTDRLTTWLEETAKACGSNIQFASANVSQTFETAKGKKSKEKPAVSYKIPLSSFKALAKVIASYKPKVEVLTLIVGVARRAIALRKRCSECFRSSSRPDSKMDDSHAYFTSTLKDVLSILGASDASRASQTKASYEPSDAKAKEASTEAFVNQFSALELKTTEDVPDSGSMKVNTSKAVEIGRSYEMEDDYDENKETAQLISLLCLLEDLQNIRDFLDQIWLEYKVGNIDLMSASVTTNTAFDLARQTIDEVQKSMPMFFETPGLVHVQVYTLACAIRGVDPEQRQQPTDQYNFVMADIAEKCFLNTYIFLNSFCSIVKPGIAFVYNKGWFGTYNPDQDRNKMSAAEKFNEDKIVLLQSLPDFTLLTQLGIPIPCEDELTKGMKVMMDTKEVPFWLTFAAQVYLDIHHVLRKSITKGFQDVRLTGLRAKKALDTHFRTPESTS